MVCFTMELNRRLQQRGSNITALGAHPGFAATDIGRHNSLVTPRNPVGRWFNQKMELLDPHRRAGRHAHHSCGLVGGPRGETTTARAASWRSEASLARAASIRSRTTSVLEVDCGPIRVDDRNPIPVRERSISDLARARLDWSALDAPCATQFRDDLHDL